MEDFFACYHDFSTVSKSDAAVLLGADCLVGDVLEVKLTLENKHRAWLISRFDQRVGYFDEEFSRQLSVLAARGLAITAILSFTAFTDQPEPGYYWGQAAVIAYKGEEPAFEAFIQNLSKKIGEGVRPLLDLGSQSVQKIIECNGTWLPSQTIALPEKKRGTAILKTHRSLSEKLIEKGRAGNKGCYAVSWIFLLLLVALIIWGLFSLFT